MVISKRLAGLANRAARKNARGQSIPEWHPAPWSPPSDPWAGVPEHMRDKVVEVLPDGTVIHTYTDTAESLAAKQRALARATKPESSEPSASPPPRAGRKRKGTGSRFAEYPMPGHEPKPD